MVATTDAPTPPDNRTARGWRWPIAYKLGLSFAVIALLGLAVLGTLALQQQQRQLQSQIEEYGGTIAHQFAGAAMESVFTDDDFHLELLTVNLVQQSRIRGAAVYDAKGHVIAQAGQVPLTDSLPRQAALTWTPPGATAPLQGFVAPVSFRDVVGGYALVSVSLESLNAQFQRGVRWLVAGMIALGLLTLGLAWWLSRRMARPIQRLVQATAALGEGRFDIQVDERRNDELGQLIEAVNRMAENLRQKQRLEGMLSHFMADDVARSMMDREAEVDVGGERVEATVMFVDIVGFTRLAESMTPEEVADFLNEYFAYFTLCSRLFFGTVNKFIGDCVMVVFGAPKHHPQHRYHAIASAVVIRRLLAVINQRRRHNGQNPVEVRIGINSGEMMAGVLGGPKRFDYTVVGDTVNVASRLCGLGDPGEIIIGQSVQTDPHVREEVATEPYRSVTVKGKTAPLQTYRVLDIDREHRRVMETLITDILEHSEVGQWGE